MNETGFQTLRRKMLTLYMFFSCSLLLAVLSLVGVMLYQSAHRNVRKQIQSDLEKYTWQVKEDGFLDHSFFSAKEVENDYVIFFYDQKGVGELTGFHGAYLSAQNRDLLWQEICQKEITSEQSTTIRLLGTGFYVYQQRVGTTSVLCYVCKDLERVRYSFFLQILILGAGFLVGCVLLYVISRHLSAKALRPVADNMKKQMEFIHAVSHELKSPLAVIMTNNSTAVLDVDNRMKYHDIIEQECKRMSLLVQDLLLMASGNTIEFHMEKKAERADTILIGCYEKMQPVVRKSGMELGIDLGQEEIGEIFADAKRVDQVLQILVDNAIAYGSSPQGIQLCVRREKRQILFLVIDHGVGVSAEDEKRMFDQFYRGARDRSDKSHFGLGLSIAKQLCRAMNAKLSFQKTAGGGATFVISFKAV